MAATAQIFAVYSERKAVAEGGNSRELIFNRFYRN